MVECAAVVRFTPAGVLRGYRDVPGSNPGVGTIFMTAVKNLLCSSSVVAYHDALSRHRLGFEFRLERFLFPIYQIVLSDLSYLFLTVSIRKRLPDRQSIL